MKKLILIAGVAAMCGGNTPALLSHEHHAFVTYAVAVADRAEADTVMGALKSEEAAQFTARALRVGDGAGGAVARLVQAAMDRRIAVAPVHEQKPARGGVPFRNIFQQTPQVLQQPRPSGAGFSERARHQDEVF